MPPALPTTSKVFRLSVVIPLYNESAGLRELLGELVVAVPPSEQHWEVIFVDDGSTDGSWELICNLAQNNERVCGLRFRRNFGKAAALSAGFARATGEYVVTMDADLQDDPAEIPKMIAHLNKGFDLVSGWKRRRHDPWHKVIPSRMFNWLVSRVTGLRLHDHNCGIKCYRREVLKELKLYGELHRFITVLAAGRGFRVAECEVRHRSRVHGQSKYGFRRFFNGLLDLITVRFLTVYGQRPSHLLGLIGLLFFFIGAAGLTYLGGLWVIGERPIGTRPLLVYSVVLVLLGAQSISFGMLAELIVWKSAPHALSGEGAADVVETVGHAKSRKESARD